ncbi:MAG: response regulator [Bdellovibrionaceae bacterium]|nr:response regulator [Pseudobdellovibrionaceae bacterium]MDW8190422.1 response regulator [Pseudobdellovibrionaceae bacterium]
MRPILCFIDDEPEILDTYREFFAHQFEVQCYSNPQVFVKELQEGRCYPDAVVTDLKMPQLLGVELIKKIRRLGFEVPVLLLSGYVEKDVAIDAMGLGTYAILEKPAPIEKLQFIVERMIIEVQLSKLQTEIRQTILQLKEIYGSLQEALLPMIPAEILDRYFVEEISDKGKRQLGLDQVLGELEQKLDQLFEAERNLMSLKQRSIHS